MKTKSRMAVILIVTLIVTLLPIPQMNTFANSEYEGMQSIVDLLNGDMEVVEDGLPKDWSLSEAPGGAVESSTELVRNGSSSVKLTDPSSTVMAGLRSERISVEVGETYAASVYSYNIEGVSRLYVEFWDENDDYITILTGVNTLPHQWQEIKIEGVVPEGTAYATLRLYQDRNNMGTAYFDDASFHRVPSDPYAALRNGTMEEVDGLPKHWSLSEGAGGIVESSMDQVHDGMYSVKLIDPLDNATVGLRSHKMLVEPGQIYHSSVYSYNEEGVSELYLEFWDENNNYIEILTARNMSLHEWNEIVVNGVAPEGAVYATLRLYLHNANVGTAYFDNAVFQEEPKPNLTNSGFEYMFHHNGKSPKHWSAHNVKTNRSTEHVYAGHYSIHVTNEDELEYPDYTALSGLSSHRLPVLPDVDYSASTRAYASDGNTAIHLDYWDASLQFLTTFTTENTIQNEWEKLEVQGKAPDQAAYASIRLHAESSWFDDAMFKMTGDVSHSKTRATYYTPSKVEAARENVQTYNWAQSLRDSAVNKADQYLAEGLDVIWESVPWQTLPRSYGVNQVMGSPVTGIEIDQYGNYPYRANPIQEPWKIVDPSSGYTFPTNDFGAYYETGLDEHGVFRPELADRDLLVNTLYPEKGSDWGVDDGFGWVDENGNRYTFIAYYVHWFLWYGTDGFIQNALTSFRDAYLYTGDIKYARAGIILLDRIADAYPEMDVMAHDKDIFLNSNSHTGRGKVVGSIWETSLAKLFISSYDAFFPAMDDEQTITFLQDKAEKYQLTNPKSSGSAIRRNMEEGILKQIYPAVKTTRIRGNDGMHQSTLAMAAVVYDTLPETKEWIDFVFESNLASPTSPTLTGGNMLNSLVSSVDRDGMGGEVAPGYNILWLEMYQLVADILEGYDLYSEADLYDNVKFRKMFSAIYPLTFIENYTANIGDSGVTGHSGLLVKLPDMVKAFDKFEDPIYAQIAYSLNNNRSNGIHKDVFSHQPEAISERIQDVIETNGTWNMGSSNLTGYGFAALRDGVNIVDDFGIRIGFPSMEIAHSSVENKLFEDSGTVQLEAFDTGERITFLFPVDETGEYDIELLPFLGTPYGEYRIWIDDEPVLEMDFFGSGGGEYVTLANRELTEGLHSISFEGIGKNPSSGGYKMGVRVLRLLDQEAREKRDNQGTESTLRDVWMYYGRSLGGHGHRDTLNLGVHHFGLDLAPDLGYPEFSDAVDMHRTQWVLNTISHNTVVVDEAKQQAHWGSEPKHFDDRERVKLIDVEAPKVYPQTDLYKRTTAMIQVDDANSYTVDFLNVKGGDDHHFSFHGAEGTVMTEGLELIEQTSGTYAGEDVEFGERVDDVDGPRYMGSGFHWLKNVERSTNSPERFSVDWTVRDTWNVYGNGPSAETDVHLRLTMLGEVDEVALADGVPPRNKPGNPSALRYMVAHRSGENLNSHFVSVIEPYRGERYIQSIDQVELKVDGEVVDNDDAAAVKVELTNGRVDYIVHSLDSNIHYTIDDKYTFQGFFGMISEEDGKAVYGYLNDGIELDDLIQNETNALTGTITDFTKGLVVDNQITVHLDQSYDNLEELIGSYIYVETDGDQNGSYRIEGITRQDDHQVILDIGGVTLVRSYTNLEDFSQGYIYNITEGASFRLPLAGEWRNAQAIGERLQQLEAQGVFSNANALHGLKLHMTAVAHFESQGENEKVAEHMEGFKLLLDHQKNNAWITDDAYRTLSEDADALIRSTQGN